MKYFYPEYQIDFTPEIIEKCCEMGVKLANEVGFVVRHEAFLEKIRNKPGVKIEGDRVFFDISLLKANLEKYRAKVKARLEAKKVEVQDEWSISAGGFSMMVRDIETDEVRMATKKDLRDLIKLINSFGISGNYPVMPQDSPPLMRALDCFKISWETADNIRPYDYLSREQTPFLYEMHEVMDKPFFVTLCISQSMRIDEKDIDIFLDFYQKWKNGSKITYQVLNYPMMGITKPVTATGNIIMYIAENISVFTLFNTFDPSLELPVSVWSGIITDLRSACWAWGHPRKHMFNYLASRLDCFMARVEPDAYIAADINLETSSSEIDVRSGMEKMSSGLVNALMGGRRFNQLGSMCVDDIYSGVQLVIDMEIVDYIKEVIGAYNPHKDIISLDDETYNSIRDVCLGKDEFISSYDTASKFRNIMPSSKRIIREKVRSWMDHRTGLKDKAREEAIERIKNFKQTFVLSADKQKALDDIYARAEKELIGKQ